MLDFDTLTQPLTPDAPCGPDLDAEGDIQYLNFLAGAEPILPSSYFDVVKSTGERGRFDPKSVDFETHFTAVKPLLARTRDLRLTVLLAKLSILNKDLPSFVVCVRAISALLENQWEEVHPRGEDGDYSYRAVTVEAIDVMPTVVNPLQFLPLIENRRYGSVTFRAYMTANGQIASSDDADLDLSTIARIVSETDLDILKSTSTTFSELAALIAGIQKTWRQNSNSAQPLSFEKLSAAVADISAWLSDIVRNREPGAVEAFAVSADPGEEQAAPGSPPQTGSATLTSPGAASAALAAIAGYFAKSEPSNPALLLVRQAQEMVGKSFVEVIRMLVPEHVEAAAVNIGRGQFFNLPIERMAALLGDSEMAAACEFQDQGFVFAVESRAQALALLGQVAGYFKTTEPSSPIPFLADRARELAQRDFLSLLQDVLPEGALKTIDNQH